MGYPQGLTRFNINASLAGGEIMVHSCWMRKDSGITAEGESLQTLTNKVRDEWAKAVLGGAGLPGGLTQYLAASTKYTNVTGYSVNALGKATGQAQATFAAAVGGNTSTGFPPQVAIVTSLLTARPGRSGRGRLYLGGLSFETMATNGRISLPARDAIAGAMAGFYTRLRAEANDADDYRPVVVSPTRTESYKITAVGVGDVFDTMRSRRNRLVEAKFTANVDA